MAIVYAWDDWNKVHITKHGCDASDAKYVIEHAQPPFPREIGGNKFLVWGPSAVGSHVEVVFAFKTPEELEFTSLGFLEWVAVIDYPATVAIYVIHVMPMKARQLRQYRKIVRET